MAKNKKQQAKMAYNMAKVKAADELAASNLVMITGSGHRVSKSVQPFTDCGLRRTGWRYGTAKDVSCPHCIDGSRYDDVIVPPNPTTDEEFAALPILNMDEFEGGTK